MTAEQKKLLSDYVRSMDGTPEQIAWNLFGKDAERHGEGFCEKAPHNPTRGGYLHDESDDLPYGVDGVSYCGRCHRAM